MKVRDGFSDANPARFRYNEFRMSGGTNKAIQLSNDQEGDGPVRSTDADAQLVAAAQAGDLPAFEALVGRHEKRIVNIAYRITGDYDDACEVAQDAFVSAFRNLKKFRGDARFSTWLTSIVINQARNRLKQVRTRRSREPVSLDDPIATEDGAMMPDPPSSSPSALERMEQRDMQRAVQDCISGLEAEFREALVLRDVQGYAYDEIGKVLKVREGTVKSRLFRAREAMKDCLKKLRGTL